MDESFDLYLVSFGLQEHDIMYEPREALQKTINIILKSDITKENKIKFLGQKAYGLFEHYINLRENQSYRNINYEKIACKMQEKYFPTTLEFRNKIFELTQDKTKRKEKSISKDDLVKKLIAMP